MDIVVFSSPYDGMTHKYFQVKYLRDKALSIFINYFYLGKLKQEIEVVKSKEYSLFWKVFLENDNAKRIVAQHSRSGGKNTFVSGYCKMDKMKDAEVINDRKRKKIIISPHHTVRNINKIIAISNFEIYSDLFLKLPKIYPDIDFVFRPHPLLFFYLSKDDVWGEKKVKNYLSDLQSNTNLVYDTAGNYFDSFVNSDALIHDCGSFLAEYFYTDKPQCYMLREDKKLEDNFMPEGIEMLDFTYKVMNEKDILKFIDDVVISNSDPLKESRLKFAKEKIRINYPSASREIINYIKNELGRK
jgi:CDP-glycerol glycerophosphotransferase (TagB/SpsB family)